MPCSSEFNSIRQVLLGEELTSTQVDDPLVSWIVDYLTGRPENVKIQCCVSDRVISKLEQRQQELSRGPSSLPSSSLSTEQISAPAQGPAAFGNVLITPMVGCIAPVDEHEYRTVQLCHAD